MKLIDEVIDADRLAPVDALVQAGAVVDEHVGKIDVEVAPPVGQVTEPALRLLGESVDQDQGLAAGVAMQLEALQPFAPLSHHGLAPSGPRGRTFAGAIVSWQ